MEEEEVPPRYRLGISSIPAEDDDHSEAEETEPPEPPEPQERAE